MKKSSKIAKLVFVALLISNTVLSAEEVQSVSTPEAHVEEAPVVSTPVVPAQIAPVVSAPAAPAPEVPKEAPKEAPKAASSQEVAMVTVNGTKISFYGRLELGMSYESGIGESPTGMWSQFVTSGGDTAQGRTYLSINRTRFGFNLSGPSKEGQPELSGRLEMDFATSSDHRFENGAVGSTTGNAVNGFDKDDKPTTTSFVTGLGGGLRVRQAWSAVKFKDIGLTILFGQTDDVISPLDPPLVNPGSMNSAGNLGNRRPQIRLTQAFGLAELAVAVVDDREAASPIAPGVQGRLGAKVPATWAGEKANLTGGVSGHFAGGNSAVLDDNKRTPEKNFEPSSWSFNADLSAPLMDILTLSGEFFMGQNLRKYGGGSINLNHTSMTAANNPDFDKEDRRKNGIQSMGWWSAVALKLPANLGLAAGLGNESLDEKSRMAGARESNMAIFSNLSYNFTPAAKVTFEWLNLATDYTNRAGDKDDNGKFKFDGAEVKDASLNRFEMNFRYDFR